MPEETTVFTDSSLSPSQKVEKLRDVLRVKGLELEGNPVDEFLASPATQAEFRGSFDNFLRWKWSEATGRGRVLAR